MPRVYKRKPGSRRYCDYTKEKLNECLQAIRNHEVTQRQAEVLYKIPRRTIINKLKNDQSPRKPGYQQIFNEGEEAIFEKCINGFCEFGFPLDTFDLRMIVKSYLDRKGRKVKRFTNNVPGQEWALSFFKRHPELNGSRFASNIKRSCAAIDETVLKEYISNLTPVVKDIPPRNIWNYDESNVTDNPGKKKVIVKRGVKYPERICNSSKSSISLMMCGNASGELLPPYVVYKSTKLWDTWTEHGPPGTRYNNTASGWFDSQVFADWFETLLLPRLKKLEGKKVIIGDNLSSHFSVEVLEMCAQNNIHFVCLHPNSTHLTHPLDVAFFFSHEKSMEEILTKWKESSGFKNTTLQKQEFPTLLKGLMEAIEPTSKENLISGFKKCGIFPISLQALLSRLPTSTISVDGKEIEDLFLKSLDEKRNQWTQTKGMMRGRKAVQVPAGKSIGTDDLIQNDVNAPGSSESVNSSDAKMNEQKKKRKTLVDGDIKKIKSRKMQVQFKKSIMNDKADEIYDEDLLVEVEGFKKEKKIEDNLMSLAEGKNTFKDLLNLQEVIKEEGKYVVFMYEGEYFPGKIIGFHNREVNISSMQKSMRSWKWPEVEDRMNYLWEDVLGGINPPKQISKRGFYEVPELDSIWS